MVNLTVATVRGIPVRLHPGFLLVLPLFAYLMARAYFSEGGGWPTAADWAWGAALAVGLFASVLIHEFAHSLMALREGITVRHITLLPMGGVSAFEELPRTPASELRITIVGPLTNFALGLPTWALAAYGLVPAWGDLPAFVGAFGLVNLVIGVFNLFLPAFPMDGGRILRALLSMRIGRLRATHAAAAIGRGIAFLMGFFGLVSFFNGGWLLLLVAFFVYAGATQEERAIRVGEVLDRFHVADVMTRDVDTVDGEMSVERAFERMLTTRHPMLPVISGTAASARQIGIVDADALAAVPVDERAFTRVREVAREAPTIAPDDAAKEATRALTNGGPLLVVNDAGLLVGVVTARDIDRLTRIAEAERGGGGRRPTRTQ